MQGLGKLDFIIESKKDCNSVKNIHDINAQYNYEDNIGGGLAKEWNLLSCGQDSSTNGYNELQRFYNTYLSSHFKGLASSLVAMKIFCECCKELPHKRRTHHAFKKCMGKKLGIDLV